MHQIHLVTIGLNKLTFYTITYSKSNSKTLLTHWHNSVSRCFSHRLGFMSILLFNFYWSIYILWYWYYYLSKTFKCVFNYYIYFFAISQNRLMYKLSLMIRLTIPLSTVYLTNIKDCYVKHDYQFRMNSSKPWSNVGCMKVCELTLIWKSLSCGHLWVVARHIQ